MDILGFIKDRLTDSVIEKVSGFLGEHPDSIGPALNSAVPIVLGTIIRSASVDEGREDNGCAERWRTYRRNS